MPKFRDKERILKASREKDTVTHKGIPIRLSDDFWKETAGKEGWARSIQSHEKQGPTNQDYSIQQSYHLEWNCFPDKVKLKEFIITKPLLHEMLKGLI